MQRTVRDNPCSDLASDQLDMLREIAKMQMGRGLDYDSKIMDKARDRAQKRFKEARERREEAEGELEELEADQMREAMEQLLESDERLEDILERLTGREDPTQGGTGGAGEGVPGSHPERLRGGPIRVRQERPHGDQEAEAHPHLQGRPAPWEGLPQPYPPEAGQAGGRPPQDRGRGPRPLVRLHHPPLRGRRPL